MDSSGNFAVGGTSSDILIVTNNALPNPFITFYEASGTIRWQKNFDVTKDYIAAMTFTPDSSKLVYVSDPVGIKTFLVIVNPATSYTIISEYRLRRSSTNEYMLISPAGLRCDGTNVYIGM